MTYRAPDHVVASELGGELVLLDLASGTYFGLDEIGAIVWQALEKAETPAQACDRIAAVYDVDRTTVEKDVDELVQQLLSKGLLTAS